MLFENTTLLLLWIACTYAVVNVFFGWRQYLVLTNQELANKLARHLDNIIHRVRVEKDRGVYYWYDMDDHEFLAQGASDEEIVGNLKSRFPDHMFFLPTNHVISAKTGWQPKIVETK